MNKTEKHKSVKAEKRKNVFDDLKKTFKRGQGLSPPAKNKYFGIDIDQKENNEAVTVKTKREIRLSTYITRDTSDLLDEIILQTKRMEKKKPKIAEILERAIVNLHQALIESKN